MNSVQTYDYEKNPNNYTKKQLYDMQLFSLIVAYNEQIQYYKSVICDARDLCDALDRAKTHHECTVKMLNYNDWKQEYDI